MKEKIHPKFYTDCKVTCGCGNSVDVCSKCHPFYTGQQRSVAARGRIEKFNKRYNVESK